MYHYSLISLLSILFLRSGHACLLSLQLCLTLHSHMDCSPPRSSVHGILQARILEWVAISFSRGFSQPRDLTCISRLLHWQVNSLLLMPPEKPSIDLGVYYFANATCVLWLYSKSKIWYCESFSFVIFQY